MKKTLLLVFCAAILLCANSVKAQTVGTPTGTTTESAAVAHPMLGGEWSVTIIVSDSKSNPISGALVSVPCTGGGNQYTNTSGQAVWNGTGTCPCTNAPVNVITSSCNKNVKIATCGTSMVTCP